MPEAQFYWQLPASDNLPDSFIESVKNYAPKLSGKYIAQLLWQRDIKDVQALAGFLNPKQYKSASPFEFGSEIHHAIERIISAKNNQEKVAIWGDFDADGITSTSLLWDGLGEFFQKNHQLTYYIPNRLTESHGLNFSGIEELSKQDYSLIITCDTGSTNIAEIEYANHLGIDIIVTDHHTLPSERPPLLAIINPRYFPPTHPLYHLSGVGVAYKLIEALYLTQPEIPQLPLTELLDLVAIGLIADLVQLTGECRYLAQIGIEKLSTQLQKTTRPGVAKLLELCRKTGDRPTDISFGIGPRINAVSRIKGDGSFCVELLTSRDRALCHQLATETELANSRRKSLQKEVAQDVTQKLTKLDLSTTRVIVLKDPQWPLGVLGLVAGQIAQEYNRPTILLTVETETINTSEEKLLARGSARSIGEIDLYQLVKNQSHLLHRFGGHPFAAGLSLPVKNIPIFTDGINQLLGQTFGEVINLTPNVIDLIVTVSELGRDLFQELKLLEPCGMGNPTPKLLIKNCWFTNPWHRNQKDLRGKKVQYIKTDFSIWDESTDTGFPGVWWGHYKDEIPKENERCDALVELDFNTYEKRYELRLIDLQPCQQNIIVKTSQPVDWILDWRNSYKARSINEDQRWAEQEIATNSLEERNRESGIGNQGQKYGHSNPNQLNHPVDGGVFNLMTVGMIPDSLSVSEDNLQISNSQKDLILLIECPTCWNDLRLWFLRAIDKQKKLALAYSPPPIMPPTEVWQQLLGIVKYLSRTGKPVTRYQLLEKLGIGNTTLRLCFQHVQYLGFNVKYKDGAFYIIPNQTKNPKSETLLQMVDKFLAAVSEEQFRQKYFCEVPLKTIEAIAAQTILEYTDSSIPF